MSQLPIPEQLEVAPQYVADRIRRRPPPDCNVLAGSTPVVAFGDPRRARVATLGLNPSRVEFVSGGAELTGPSRRFETLRSLRRTELDDAPDDVVARVWERSNNYFHRRPYGWFKTLDELLRAAGVSYWEDTACHLDLCQWATDPTWGRLTTQARERLVSEDAEFLRTQLCSEPIRLLFLNGRSVLSTAARLLSADLRAVNEVGDGSVRATIYAGSVEEIAAVGWSTNLQSSFGVTKVLRAKLAKRVSELSDEVIRSNDADPLCAPDRQSLNG